MVLDGSTPIVPKETVTIGHEAVGEIVELGATVANFSKGDKIGFVNAYNACWECEGCARHYGSMSKWKIRYARMGNERFPPGILHC